MALSLAPAAARAGETACWFEDGVVVVAASVAGVAGDYILDTGSARTLLHETRANAEGIEAAAGALGPVRLAGVTTPPLPVGVADLDVRTWNLPTAAIGLIGMDVLKDYVVDIRFSPCRVRLSRPAEAPAFRVAQDLPLGWDLGRPTVPAEARDGARRLTGPFVIATGMNVPARLAEDVAAAPAEKPQELYPDGAWLARLETLRIGGREVSPAGAGLAKPDGEVAGVVGASVFADRPLRFDFPGSKLSIGPPK